MHYFRHLYLMLWLAANVGGSLRASEKEAVPFYAGRYSATICKSISSDSLQVFLLKDSLNKPFCYVSRIFTPVCFDNTCKAVRLTIYWDVCGTFLGFKVPDNNPLTKKDHNLFTSYDYYTLYTILNNPGASIASLNKQQLVNYSTDPALDGYTGATTTEAENVVVAGAAYTTYTLWHWVYKANDLMNSETVQNNNNSDFWLHTFALVADMPADELAKWLYAADKNKMLKKFKIQQQLVRDINKMTTLNALLINNYLQRQVFLHFDIGTRLRNCKSIKQAFSAMVPL